MCRYICNISTASYTDVSSTLAVEIESVVSEKFKSMIIQAKERGEISPNVDAPFAAFWLDGFITKLLLSYSTVYYREEMKIYLGDRAFQDDYLIDRIITAVRRSLGTPHRWEEE
ncbi:hypothetical protein [Desulforhopalus singaporensis]|nr:hypothetical protein [Desulforhopalus singaporensis]